LPRVEPGYEEVIEQFAAFNACEMHLVVNKERLGLNSNTYHSLAEAYARGAAQIVHLEDDVVPSPDALEYFTWAISYLTTHDPRHTHLLASGYNKPESEPDKALTHCTARRPIWTPWGWGVDRGRLGWLLEKWCHRNPKCFTCAFKSKYRNTRSELFPVLSRIQNIGYEDGENGRTPEWYRANHRTPWVASRLAAARFREPGDHGN